MGLLSTYDIKVSSVRNQALPFMFEVEEKGKVTTYELPVNPEAYRISYPTRATTTYTLGGVFEDNIGNGLSKITLQGTFGYKSKMQGEGSKNWAKSGWDYYNELEQAFLKFYDAFGSVQTKGAQKFDPILKSPRLHFYNYTDKHYFAVQLNKFDFLRSTQRKFLYQFDIQATVLYDLLTAPYNKEPEDILVSWEVRSPGILSKLVAGYAAVMGAISDFNNMMNDLTAGVEQLNNAISGFTSGVTSAIKAPFSLVRTCLAADENMLHAIKDMTNLPHEITHELRMIKTDLLRLMGHKDKFQDSTSITNATAVTASTGVEVVTAPVPKEQASIVPMFNPETTTFATQEVIISEQSLQQVGIKDSDTLESIAANNGGNWQIIAKANGLEYPFLVKTPMEKFSEVLQKGTSGNNLQAGDNIIYLNGITTAALGKLIVFGDAAYYATIDSIDSAGTAKLNSPVPVMMPMGTAVTIHERMLAVLTPGDNIKIPTNGKQVQIYNAEEFAAKLYGSDEWLDDAGEADLDGTGDYKTVTGISNLCMQLTHRLNTRRGELALLGHPTYGSDVPKFVGMEGEQWVYERILLEAELTIREDQRVERIENLSMQVEDTATYITADVYPIRAAAPERLNALIA